MFVQCLLLCSIVYKVIAINPMPVFIKNGESSKTCDLLEFCVGEEYECYSGRCYCTEGFVPNFQQTACVPCPGLGEMCYTQCCNTYKNLTLYCFQGLCQTCRNPYGGWTCRDSMDQMLYITITQVLMAVALILGIVITLILLFKLCLTTRISRRNNLSQTRLSIGSLQLYVDQRLRNAPPRNQMTSVLQKYTSIQDHDAIDDASANEAFPRYSRSPPPEAYVNSTPEPQINHAYVPDGSIPPPPYTPEIKNEDNNQTIHI